MSASEFQAKGLRTDLQQLFYTRSVRNVLRGMHLQVAPHAQSKLVCCISGSILDVLVDLRPETQGFGRSISFRLTGKTPQALYVPPGVAHGFLVESDGAVPLLGLPFEYS